MIDVMQKSATPPNTPGIMRRVFSMLYETLLLLAVMFIAGFLFISITHDTTSTIMKSVFRGYLLLVSAGYFAWFWQHGGQTLAMKTWRMKIISSRGGAITLTQAGLRFSVALFGIMLGGVGILWAILDRDKQFLHDRLAGTRIITTDRT